MTRRRNKDKPEHNNDDPSQQLEAVHSLEENLDLLTTSIKRIEDELNTLYTDFQVTINFTYSLHIRHKLVMKLNI